MRKDLDTHQKIDCPNRDYVCLSCGERGTYATITDIHDKTCQKKKVPCSNAGCTKTMERQKIHEHVRTQCPHTVLSCKYKGIGCTSELKRKDMAAHEQDDKHHLHMALEMVNELHEEEHLTLKNKGKMIFELSEYQKKKEAGKMFISPSFYTHPKGYHMAVKVYTNGSGNGKSTHVAVSAQILEGRYDAQLKWPFSGKVTITILNHLEDKNHHTDTIPIADAGVGSNVGTLKFTPLSALAHNLVKNTQYLVDNTLYFRVSVEVTDRKPWLQCPAQQMKY